MRCARSSRPPRYHHHPRTARDFTMKGMRAFARAPACSRLPAHALLDTQISRSYTHHGFVGLLDDLLPGMRRRERPTMSRRNCLRRCFRHVRTQLSTAGSPASGAQASKGERHHRSGQGVAVTMASNTCPQSLHLARPGALLHASGGTSRQCIR